MVNSYRNGRPLFGADQYNPEEDDERLPTESQLVLLCLDYLRDLRRSYLKQDLRNAEGLDADYLSVAIYALSRCFLESPLTNQEGSDAMMDRNKANLLTPGLFPVQDPQSSKNFISIPNLNTINQEILYSKNPAVLDSALDTSVSDVDHQDPTGWYSYDDSHRSNDYRFYPLDGLASGPSLKGPLSLGELVVAGLVGMGGRSRYIADEEVKESLLFEQFVSAVRAKGFFKDPESSKKEEDEDERLERAAQLEEERYRKVVGKFRTKLATRAQQELNDNEDEGPPLYDDQFVMSAGERQEQRRQANIEAARKEREGDDDASPTTSPGLSVVTSLTAKLAPGGTPRAAENGGDDAQDEDESSPTRSNHGETTSPAGSPEASSPRTLTAAALEAVSTPRSSTAAAATSPTATESPRTSFTATSRSNIQPLASPTQDNPVDIEEAERLKSVGNGHMQRKEYDKAAEAYTAALTISPNGPNTHVYFSNRAAALLSMKQFDQAIADSERSLALKPDYGKAHARLGLAHFLLGNYRQAVEAYTVSLKYDPDNKSTKTYLEKAAKRAAEQEDAVAAGASSFSFVSEWDKSESKARTPEELEERKRLIQQKEAEKLKLKGNSQMANRDYQAALDAYTAALKTCPDGLNSHVYYSNRAAALCYLERYEEAEADSVQSLKLVPNYGKAHARLGLSRFFMGDYAGAIEAYTAALEYDPDNAASKSYLAKARARLARQNQEAKVIKRVPSEDGSLEEIMNDASLRKEAELPMV